MKFSRWVLALPDWVEEFLANREPFYPTVEKKMGLVIELSRLNIEHGTGGPFGAGVFDMQSNRLIAPGVNLVIPTNCSVAHAEIVALMLAQQNLHGFDLGGQGMPACELVASTEPCAMCFGAIPWSGVQRLVCGARDEDARSIGFDEGPKLPDWVEALERRRIPVLRDVCREQAAAVLHQYAESNGKIYNGRQGQTL